MSDLRSFLAGSFFMRIVSFPEPPSSSGDGTPAMWTRLENRVNVQLCVSHTQQLSGRYCTLRLIGVGIDIVDLENFRCRLDQGLLEELFLCSEIEYCSSRARPWESYAARFAAKEAVFKALGAGLSQGLRWRDVEIVKEESGGVSVSLTGKALAMAEEMNVKTVNLSVSHTRSSAVALATAQG